MRRYTDGVGVSRLVGLGWPNLYIWLSGWYWLLVGTVDIADIVSLFKEQVSLVLFTCT